MFEPDSYQIKALRTWYAPDSPLHNDPLHPVIKLAGEAGELLDLYGKHQYKPHFSWLDCVRCGEKEEWHKKLEEWGYPHPYIPKVLDELGDLSYYLRILAYQQKTTFEHLTQICQLSDIADMPMLLADLNLRAAFILSVYINSRSIFYSDLVYATGVFLAVLQRVDCTLDRLIELNYQKLNGDASNHGWRGAK